MSDVALEVGVSETTVSHALSGKRHVSEDTIAKVREACERLNYRPNHVARSFRSKRTFTIALIVPDLTNPFYPSLARGLQDVLFESGYQTLICDSDSRADMEESLIDQAIDRQVDGIVVAPILAAVPPKLLAIPQVPVVLISSSHAVAGRVLQLPNMDAASNDDEGGMLLAAEHLIAQGHRRIGYITAPMSLGPAQRRFDGFRRALRQADCPFDERIVATTTFTREGGSQGLRQIMAAPNPPTAVLCANDLLAIGAMDYAGERSIRIPDDLAVVGYDDIESASLVSPQLTTVHVQTRALGKACGQFLVERMTGTYAGPPRQVLIPNTLVARDSA